jgi:Holliday junction resolvase RusA-like endonuclease
VSNLNVTFTVPGKPVSVNAAYKRRNLANGGKGLMLSEEAKWFKATVGTYALLARQRTTWPKLSSVLAVDLTIVTWNCRHDADAPVKLLQDALERILYVRDSVVRSVTASRAKDVGGPRIVVTVESKEPEG